MTFSLAFAFCGLTLLYVVLITGLIILLRRLRIGDQAAIFMGFLIFGATSAVISALVWPLDLVVYPNLYAVLLGDQLYAFATGALGASDPSHAHEAVPWLLRVPQVYVIVSVLLSGVVGSLVADLFSLIHRRRISLT